MIRAYDDNGNVYDLVKYEKEIRADEINKFKDWFEENYCYDSYICCVVRNSIKKYEKQKGESNDRTK